MTGLRKILILLVVAISVCVAPARAYAEDGGGGGHSFDAGIGYGVVLGPVAYDRDTLTGSHKVGYVIYANNRYDAACYALGLDVAEVNGITAEQRAKLSNAETGGDFYTFAQRAYQFGANSVPSWVPIGSNLSELFGQGDSGKVWALDGFVGFPFGTEYQDAKEDMQAILDGEDIGGGGGSGGTDEEVTIGSFRFLPWSGGTANGRILSLIRPPWYPDQDGTTENWDISALSVGTDNLFFASYTYSGTGKRPRYIVLDSGLQIMRLVSSGSGVLYVVNTDTVAHSFTFYATDSLHYPASGTTNYTVKANLSWDATRYTLQPNTYYDIQSNNNLRSYGYCYSSGNSTPVTPPSNWPDAPETVTPTPPSLPEPTSVTKPTYPTKIVRITNTYTADLQGILDAMDEHCQHLQDEIYTDLKNTFDGMTDYLGDEFDELKQYLHDLFEWLADELDFAVSGSGYSDSTVVSWLKKIWAKIGSGVNTRPVDPLVNTDGAWKWLTDLFAGFLAVLAEKGLELSGALHGLLDDLVEKFPFSVPWDVLALLALFTADPVTPLIEFEIPMLGGTVVPVSIDLSNYDALMAIVRPVELVAFGAWLLWLTPEVLKSLNVSIGGGD